MHTRGTASQRISFGTGFGDDLEIELLDTTLPGYETSLGRVTSNPLLAGRRVDLPVQLGRAACGSTVSGQGTAAVRVVSESGSASRVTVPITDENGLLERLQKRTCDVQRVEQAVDLELSESWQQTGSGPEAAVRGQVTIALRPGTDWHRSPMPSPASCSA